MIIFVNQATGFPKNNFIIFGNQATGCPDGYFIIFGNQATGCPDDYFIILAIRQQVVLMIISLFWKSGNRLS